MGLPNATASPLSSLNASLSSLGDAISVLGVAISALAVPVSPASSVSSADLEVYAAASASSDDVLDTYAAASSHLPASALANADLHAVSASDIAVCNATAASSHLRASALADADLHAVSATDIAETVCNATAASPSDSAPNIDISALSASLSNAISVLGDAMAALASSSGSAYAASSSHLPPSASASADLTDFLADSKLISTLSGDPVDFSVLAEIVSSVLEAGEEGNVQHFHLWIGSELIEFDPESSCGFAGGFAIGPYLEENPEGAVIFFSYGLKESPMIKMIRKTDFKDMEEVKNFIEAETGSTLDDLDLTFECIEYSFDVAMDDIMYPFFMEQVLTVKAYLKPVGGHLMVARLRGTSEEILKKCWPGT